MIPSKKCQECGGLAYVDEDVPVCSIRYGFIQKEVTECETFKKRKIKTKKITKKKKMRQCSPNRGVSDEDPKQAVSFASYLMFTNGRCPICGAQVYPCDNFTQKVDLELGIQHYKQPEHPERWKEATENLKAMGMM